METEIYWYVFAKVSNQSICHQQKTQQGITACEYIYKLSIEKHFKKEKLIWQIGDGMWKIECWKNLTLNLNLTLTFPHGRT